MQDTVFSLILATLRGFCLPIIYISNVGISAKKPAQIPYPASYLKIGRNHHACDN